jgi:TonB-dependent starch-binding outer membrane protein SusC
MQKKSTGLVYPATNYCKWIFLLLFPIFLTFFSFETFAQTVKVSGVVKDGTGSVVNGASVNVKGTSIGTITDSLGHYSLNAPGPNSIIIFSLVGFVSVEQVVGTKKTINVSLSASVSNLDEVIVVGYGTQKRRDVTGAISSVSEKDIKERNPVTLFDALQGKAAGVLITNDNGDPSGQGTIQIRGASTINSGNGPLYVIDGIISENADFLNPTDIETIDILKDASSTAIYGARGANGVILITTKKGKAGKPLISFNTYRLYGKLAHELRTTTASELRKYRASRGDANNGYNLDSLNPYLNADNNYQDLLFRTGVKQVASLSIGGGAKGISYYGGITYTDDQSIVTNSWLKRVQSKINVSYQATNKLTVSHSLAFAYQTGNTIPIGNSAKQVFERNPWTSIYRPDGSLAGYVESKRNPVAQALYNINMDNNYTVQFNTQMVYKLTKDLNFTTLFNAQLDNNNNRSLSPSSLTSGGLGDATGSNTFGKNFTWEYQSYFNYNKKLHDHSLTATAAFSANRRREDEIRISMYKYLTEDILIGNIGTIDLPTNKTYTDATAYSGASLIARIGDTYKGRYIVQGTYRRDGSSRFGADNRWGDFYSGSAAWRFSAENFMNGTQNWLNDGKLRISYGKAGNDRLGSNYGSYTTVIFGGDYYNGFSGASESTSLGNNTLHWESTTSLNYGLDLTLIKNKLNVTVDYYTKRTDDLLYGSKLPPESGKQNVNINLGSILNKGLEFSAVATVVSKKDFSMQVSGNISFQSSSILELNNHTPFPSGKWLIQEGGKIGDFYIWKNLGVYQWNESNAYDANGIKLTPSIGSNGLPTGTYTLNGEKYSGTVYNKYRNGFKLQGGDTEWYDANNDGVIDDQDKVIAGNGLPKYFYGVGTTITYKNWSLNFLFNGQVGNKIYNSVRNGQNANSSTYTPPIYDAVLTAWRKPGDISVYPDFKLKDTRGSMSVGYNSLYLEDGSFLRLSSVRLAYNLGQRALRSIKMKQIGAYIYGNNLLTWTDYSWYDPEFSSKGLNIGEDNGKYPKRREIGVGINVNF